MTTSRHLALTHVSFAHRAGTIAKELDALPGDDALALAASGRELEREFESWGIEPPHEDERQKAIGALADFQRRAREFLANRKSK